MNNDFNGQQPMQQPMPQQPMGQPMQQPMMGGAPAPKGKNPAVLVAGVLIGIIVLVLLFFLISTKTLTCKTKHTKDDYKVTSVEKITFRFGKPVSTYTKSTYTFDDKDDAKEFVDYYKKLYKEYCKKKDGCTYSLKSSGKKVTSVVKNKLDEDDQEAFEKKYDSFKEYKKDFKDQCKEEQDED